MDYDPGASEVNPINRIKLMLSHAVKNASAVSQDVEIGKVEIKDSYSELMGSKK